MFDLEKEIELLERCASECALISDLATDIRVRDENKKLAFEYKQIVADLKSYRQVWTTPYRVN
jgi:hypothetical protein